MNKETKICQNCKKDFTIEPEDFSFYEKIKVPPPTFCAECIMLQILFWRNQRFLYKRKCSLTGENIVSIYDDNVPFPVYKSDIWKSDKWDPFVYGVDYNFDENFFIQFKKLFNQVPKIAINHMGTVVNSDYSNIIFDSKNVYLSSSVLNSEDVMYSSNVDYSKNIVDSDRLVKCEECYECLNSEQCFNCHFVFDSKSCIDSEYLFDCVNCQNCFMCTNQRNQNYMILNKQYSKDEYRKFIDGLDRRSNAGRRELLERFFEFKQKAVHKYNRNRAVQNVTGDTTENSSNCHNVYLAYDSENIKNAIRVVKSKDSMNVFGIGPNGELLYQDLTCSLGTTNTQFSININGSTNIQYSYYCANCQDIFGCIGLKNAKYCILNKQYSKEDYFALVEKIRSHMSTNYYTDSLGRCYKFGDFFPFELSPFAYNETVALDFRLMNQEEAKKFGFRWKDRIKSNYTANIDPDLLPDEFDIKQAKELVVSCKAGTLLCSSAFRYSETEISFYIKHGLPLPEKCPMCRQYDRIKRQYPFQLFNRVCMCDKDNHPMHAGKCNTAFKTTYSPDRPEIVYCEKCYQQEVY